MWAGSQGRNGEPMRAFPGVRTWSCPDAVLLAQVVEGVLDGAVRGLDAGDGGIAVPADVAQGIEPVVHDRVREHIPLEHVPLLHAPERNPNDQASGRGWPPISVILTTRPRRWVVDPRCEAPARSLPLS